MQVSKIRFLLIVMISELLLPGVASAQSADDARDAVLEAVQATIALVGYHFRLKSNAVNSFIQEGGFVSNTNTIQAVEGDVAGSGDRQITRQLLTGESFEEAMKAAPFVIKQIVSNGETYVNFHTTDTVYGDMLDIQPGWWVYDQLVNSVDGGTTLFAIQQYSKAETVLEIYFREDYILAAEELEPQADEGISLRVFDVEVDALQLLVEQVGFSTAQDVYTFTYSKDVLEAGEITTTFRLWIGAEDGLVYRGRGESRLFIPYATAGGESSMTFDQDTRAALEFTISQHGEAVNVSPPDPASINE